MGLRVLTILAAAASIASGTAYAHHSFAGYLARKVVTIQGEVIQFSFRNPHSFLEVIVADGDGQPQKWVVEWGSIEQLANGGMTKKTLKVGDGVVITGNPRSNPAEHRLRLLKIVRPSDGWTWRWEGPYVG